jgi:cytoskeletal protein CcmA (bactofilin family)
MFGSSNDSKKAPRPSATSTYEGLIGQRMVIEGDLRFSGGLMVEGTVKGSIQAEPDSDAVLVVSPQGRIEGQLNAPQVELSGTIEGDIVAAERLILGASAKVHGNIYYKVLEMAAGAQVSGQMIFQDVPQRRLSGPTQDSSTASTDGKVDEG